MHFRRKRSGGTNGPLAVGRTLWFVGIFTGSVVTVTGSGVEWATGA